MSHLHTHTVMVHLLTTTGHITTHICYFAQTLSSTLACTVVKKCCLWHVTTCAGHPVPWSGTMNTEIQVHCWIQFYQGHPLLNIHRTNHSLSCFASSPKNSAILGLHFKAYSTSVFPKLVSTETNTSHAQQVSETFTSDMKASLQQQRQVPNTQKLQNNSAGIPLYQATNLNNN